ncbi:hypothetical protein V2J09_020892 [Rumex salicifolius]
MLAISPLRPNTKDEVVDITSFSDLEDQFADFPEFAASVGCLLDSIDFDDLIHNGDVLPDLEMEPADFMVDFSVSAGDVIDDDSDTGVQVVPDFYENDNTGRGGDGSKNSGIEPNKDDDDDESEKSTTSSSLLTRSAKEREKSKKLGSSQSKKSSSNNEGKRKTKVDWTPDLHRRFVQAVEQLGVDKAVPSRILELMGIHCLTRHNVASHLQVYFFLYEFIIAFHFQILLPFLTRTIFNGYKYRSHRKHLLAREAEAANWSQKRQMYGIAVTPAGGGGGGKTTKVNHPWGHPPTIGFPPTPPPIHHPFRPLHVWGHPSHHVEPHTVMPMWPKQPTPTWAAQPLVDPSFWHPHHQHVTTPTSCFPQTLPATRFATAPPVPGIPPPHAATMYKHQQTTASSPPNHPPIDLLPTKESIDAALGDILNKPWLPLPIGLKPPSMDSVMVELQRQGVPKIPPS